MYIIVADNAVLGQIAAKSHDVVDIVFANLAEHISNMLFGGGNACEVGHYGNSVKALDARSDFDRELGSRARSAVCDGHERGSQCSDRACGSLYVIKTCLSLGREYLKRDRRGLVCKYVVNLHNKNPYLRIDFRYRTVANKYTSKVG